MTVFTVTEVDVSELAQDRAMVRGAVPNRRGLKWRGNRANARLTSWAWVQTKLCGPPSMATTCTSFIRLGGDLNRQYPVRGAVHGQDRYVDVWQVGTEVGQPSVHAGIRRVRGGPTATVKLAWTAWSLIRVPPSSSKL
jgi:hypothetical protein